MSLITRIKRIYCKKYRLYFIGLSLGSLLLGGLLLGFLYFYPKPSLVSIWQGYTSLNQTQITVLSPSHLSLSYFLDDQEPVTPIHQIVKGGWHITHLLIPSLKVEKKYLLTVKDQQKKIIAKKQFQTLDLDKKSLTFAVASCMDDRWDQKIQVKMWKDLLSFRPDMIFLIGDNVYADKYVDTYSTENFLRRYVETIRTLHLYKADPLVPILAVWDDHDYGKNNGDRHFPLKTQMQKMFREFFPLFFDKKHLYPGKGISFLIKTASQNFIFMDDRSFRSSNKNRKGSLWGKNQTQWLYDHLSSTKIPSWLINGGQIFGRHHRFESFERNFPIDFKKVIQKISKLSSPVIFLSGDRHLTELQKIGDYTYPLYELTTSGIHAVTDPREGTPLDPNRHIHQVTNQLNYAIISSQGVFNDGLLVHASVYGLNKKTLFSEEIAIHK